MKVTSKHQAITRKNSDICVVTEYPAVDRDLDFAIVNVSGRYPDTGRAVNRQCKEIVYVQEGSGKVTVDGTEQALIAGDLVLIEAGETFVWEGTMTLFIACHPAFTVEQHQLVA